MGTGLQIWGPSGSITLDTSTLVSRVIGRINIQGPTSSSITVTKFSSAETVWAFFVPLTFSSVVLCTVSVSGSVIDYNLQTNVAGFIVYGVF